MSNRRLRKTARTVLIAAAAVLLVSLVLWFAWWKTMSDLSLRTVSLFAAEIERAERDSLVTSVDLQQIRQLRAIAARAECSTVVRVLCTGVGIAPLLRGSITEGDRQDIAATLEFLAPKNGNVSWMELSSFLQANPSIRKTLRGFRGLVHKEAG